MEGFNFDPTNVNTELANCNAIIMEYQFMFDCGMLDVEVELPLFIERLRNAGSDRIVSEMQSQVDSWKIATGR